MQSGPEVVCLALQRTEVLRLREGLVHERGARAATPDNKDRPRHTHGDELPAQRTNNKKQTTTVMPQRLVHLFRQLTHRSNPVNVKPAPGGGGGGAGARPGREAS